MLSYERVWAAIDRLAQHYNLSASGLARKAGLDATSFNRSKRISPEGRQRWPSTESIAKVLAATGASLDEFLRLIEPRNRAARAMIPLIGMAQVGDGDVFTRDGMPAGGPGWEEIEFPGVPLKRVFALRVEGRSMEPLYRDGEVLIVCPAARLRKGDRVVVRTNSGEILAKEFKRRRAGRIELRSLNPEQPDSVILAKDVAWVGRVMWVRH
jgi:phage repressor protein C with HTH and peptisase S24 domain